MSLAAAEILRLIPVPPAPPKRAHRLTESLGDRMARWRFDAIIAVTALVQALPLVHNNTEDFEAIRAMILNPAVRSGHAIGSPVIQACASRVGASPDG